MYCLHAAGMLPGTAAFREGSIPLAAYTIRATRMPAQRQAEVLGTLTHAQLHVLYKPTLCSFLQGIGSGQRQLIAVTCIAEHA